MCVACYVDGTALSNEQWKSVSCSLTHSFVDAFDSCGCRLLGPLRN